MHVKCTRAKNKKKKKKKILKTRHDRHVHKSTTIRGLEKDSQRATSKSKFESRIEVRCRNDGKASTAENGKAGRGRSCGLYLQRRRSVVGSDGDGGTGSCTTRRSYSATSNQEAAEQRRGVKPRERGVFLQACQRLGDASVLSILQEEILYISPGWWGGEKKKYAPCCRNNGLFPFIHTI